MFNTGFWTIGRYAGAPVRIHWTVLLLMVFFGRFEPAAWVGILLLVLLHEFGHAVIVRAVGARVTEVMAYGFGGYCAWQGRVSDRDRALIAWGGVAAQAVLLCAALMFQGFVGVTDRTSLILMHTFIDVNINLIILNLIPIPPLDGAEAWKLVPYLRDDVKRWWARQRNPRPKARAKPKGAGRDDNVVPLRPDAPKPTNGASGHAEPSRVTDPSEADRVFEKVFKGLVDKPPKDDE